MEVQDKTVLGEDKIIFGEAAYKYTAKVISKETEFYRVNSKLFNKYFNKVLPLMEK